eukprot:12779769-Alexandrium_andersonii.AAC.2
MCIRDRRELVLETELGPGGRGTALIDHIQDAPGGGDLLHDLLRAHKVKLDGDETSARTRRSPSAWS